MSIVEFKKVNKRIRNKQIISDMSLAIEQGEVFGLLGPNGAGKTTLIKLMLGLLNTDSGEILINEINNKTDQLKAIEQVGALVEAPVYYPYLSGRDNLKIFAKLTKATPETVEEIIEIIGLREQITKKVSAYSLGMKQRLGLGIALMRKPDILVLDEPTNGLDPEGIVEIRSYLREIASKQGITVIVSSHMLSEMNLLCDRFAIIDKGKLVRTMGKEDYAMSASMQQYVLQTNDAKQAFDILSSDYKVNWKDQIINCKATREEIADIVKILVEHDLRVYMVQPDGNPLEKLYFDSISQVEGKV